MEEQYKNLGTLTEPLVLFDLREIFPISTKIELFLVKFLRIKVALSMEHTMAHVQKDELIMSTEDLLQAQLQLYHHSFAYVKSMALRAATDLRIPDAIHRHGGAATLCDLAAEAGIHTSKLSHLRRLMRVLTISGIFTVQDCDGDVMYKLTRVSRLLVGGGESSRNLSPMVRVLVKPVTVATLFSIREWFTDEREAAMSLFEAAHGHGYTQRWMTEKDSADGSVFNAAMAADSRIVMEIVLTDSSSIFQGVSSLVDAGGGHGAVAAAVARALPHVKCTVLDLPYVVAGAPTDGNVQFVAGDMFEYIPPADVVLLKWILHDWQDEDCVKILRRCKEAIPARDAGGKVKIIDMVVGFGSQEIDASKETQLLFDLYMMYVNGVEREEHEWRKIFFEAGFSDHKITPVLGARSIIEVFP